MAAEVHPHKVAIVREAANAELDDADSAAELRELDAIPERAVPDDAQKKARGHEAQVIAARKCVLANHLDLVENDLSQG